MYFFVKQKYGFINNFGYNNTVLIMVMGHGYQPDFSENAQAFCTDFIYSDATIKRFFLNLKQATDLKV